MLRSVFIWALSIFVVLNFVLVAGYRYYLSQPDSLVAKAKRGEPVTKRLSLPLLAFLLQEHNEKCVSSALSFLNSRPAPEVVILGSSQVEDPFWALDNPADQESAAKFFYHQADTFSQEISRLCGRKIETVNLGTPHLMASDAYLYLTHHLSDSKKPKVIVLGVAPRDFYDSHYPKPADSPNYRPLMQSTHKSVDLPKALEANIFSERTLTDWCFLFARRDDLRKMFIDIRRMFFRRPATTFNARVEPNVSHTQKGSGKTVPHRRTVPATWYHSAYRNIEAETSPLQFEFLEHFLKLSRELHVRVIVLEVPLEKPHRDLLPPGFSPRFTKKLSVVCTQFGAEFVNAEESISFDANDFANPEHLNASGGRKLLNILAPRVAKALSVAPNNMPNR